MKKIDLGQTVSIIANLGVIAGIVFLAIELSQNTDAMRSQTVQALQSEYREIFDFSPNVAEAAMKATADRTPIDRYLRNALFFRLMRIYENQWYQFSRGYLDEQLFVAYQQHLRITLSDETFWQTWELRKAQGFFHPDFVAYVEAFIVENPPLGLL